MRAFGRSRCRGRRAVPRASMSLQAALLSGAEERRAVLMDISRTGARLAGKNLPSDGQEVRLKIGNVEALGEVVRSDARQCAVAFDMPIGIMEMNRVRTLANFVRALGSI